MIKKWPLNIILILLSESREEKARRGNLEPSKNPLKRLALDRVHLWILRRRKIFNFEILTLSGFDRFVVLPGMCDLYVLLEGAHIEICLVARSRAHETSILDSLILCVIDGLDTTLQESPQTFKRCD